MKYAELHGDVQRLRIKSRGDEQPKGNSVPYTGKLVALAKHQVAAIIDKTLKDDARKYFDIEAFLQFKNTQLRAGPSTGTSTTAITLDSAGTSTVTNNVALGTGHVKAIVDTMKERNICKGVLAA